MTDFVEKAGSMRGHGLVNRRILPYTLTPVSALTALTHPAEHNEAVYSPWHGIRSADESRSINLGHEEDYLD